MQSISYCACHLTITVSDMSVTAVRIPGMESTTLVNTYIYTYMVLNIYINPRVNIVIIVILKLNKQAQRV